MSHGVVDHSMHSMNHSMMDHSMHQAMNDSVMDHSMHAGMDHGSMDHSMHGAMDPSAHGAMDHGSMDHGDMDHGGMDHGGMDHGGMDHGGMDHGGMDGMSMTFHFGVMEKVLFSGWQVHSSSTMMLSMVGIFFMAAIYEGIKYFREHLLWEAYNSLQYRVVNANGVREEDPPKPVVREVTRKNPPQMFSRKHCLQTVLHVIQLTISYLLMLIFMTYNVWLCIAVVAGSATGYFLFGWKRTVVVDMTETCH